MHKYLMVALFLSCLLPNYATSEDTKMRRRNFASGAKWESIVGYSRAVRVGNMVYVSGTTATDSDGNIVGLGNINKQTNQVLENIEKALLKAGANLKDVVRTRIYVTDIKHWEQVAEVHGKYFQEIRPVTSMVEVRALISPEILVEIEADAVVE